MTTVREDAAGGGWHRLGVLILAVIVIGLPISNAVDYAALLAVVLIVVCGNVRTHPRAWLEALGLVIFVVIAQQLLSPPRIEEGHNVFMPSTELEKALPADIAIFTAAVADWRVASEGEQKLKKTSAGMPPLQLVENPDILATISKLKDKRPPLVIGFAAETEHLIDNAKAKIARKGCDWIVANDVSPSTGVMGGDRNTVHLLTRDGEDINVDSWPVMTKEQVATELVATIAKTLEKIS